METKKQNISRRYFLKAAFVVAAAPAIGILPTRLVNADTAVDVPKIAVVEQNRKIVTEIDLNKVQEPQYIKLEDGLKVTVLAEKGKIRVLDAECRDKICVNAGWLTKPGDKAICMPAKAIVFIKS